MGAEALDNMLLAFVEQFPGHERDPRPGDAARNGWPARPAAMPHRAAALEELLLLWTANRNQAFKPFEELFEDKHAGGEDRLPPGDRADAGVFRHAAADSAARRQADQPARSAARAGGGLARAR